MPVRHEDKCKSVIGTLGSISSKLILFIPKDPSLSFGMTVPNRFIYSFYCFSILYFIYKGSINVKYSGSSTDFLCFLCGAYMGVFAIKSSSFLFSCLRTRTLVFRLVSRSSLLVVASGGGRQVDLLPPVVRLDHLRKILQCLHRARIRSAEVVHQAHIPERMHRCGHLVDTSADRVPAILAPGHGELAAASADQP